jgi:PAS domain S-box-containing protein
MIADQQPEMPRHQLDKRLDYVLKLMLEKSGATLGCIYVYDLNSDRLELIGHRAERWIEELDAVSAWLQPTMATLNANDFPQTLPTDDENTPTAIRDGILWPISIVDRLVGAVALLTDQTDQLDEDMVADLQPDIMLVQTIIENLQLTERLIDIETLTQAAQRIAQNPSPQHIIHVLRDYLFGQHISSGVLFLLGPVRDDNPNGPFEYVEIAGSWSRKQGGDVGLGRRFDIESWHDVFAVLDKNRIMLMDIDDLKKRNLNQFHRRMVDADNVKYVALLPLQSDHARLGVLAITTDGGQAFSPHELRVYQIVTEFLTMSTMAAALQQHESFVQQSRAALLDAVNDGVLMVLPDEAATVLTINEHFTDMFGLHVAEAQGKSLWDLLTQFRISPRTRQTLLQRWQQITLNSAQGIRGEFQMSASTANQVDVQWYSGPVYQYGEVIGRIFTFHDITPERASERLRSELLSRISHELRTPLTSIRGFAEFILEAEGENLPSLAKEYTEIIVKSAIHLNHIFTDMIEITRANAGELKMQFREVNLPDIIREVVKRMTPQFHQHAHQVITELDADIPPLQADGDRIDQILTNLISNAIKYSSEGSEIRLSAQYIEDAAALPASAPPDTPAPCVLVSVVDQGQGLSADEAEKIFLPFYRTKDARSNKIEGAGLGLAISISIVELHRGRIWVEPATRQKPGGRFLFTLAT